MSKSHALSKINGILSTHSENNFREKDNLQSNKARQLSGVSSVFTSVMSQLSTRMSLFSFRGFIEPLQLSIQSTNELIICLAPTEFHANWVKDHYLIEMEAIATKFSKNPVQIQIIDEKNEVSVVGKKVAANDSFSSPIIEQQSLNQQIEAKTEQPLGDYPYAPAVTANGSAVYSFSEQKERQQKNKKKVEKRGSVIDQKFTFDRFIDLPKQRMAFMACQSVAKAPGQQFNPLIVAGDTGLGKSHLLQAIAHQARVNNPELKVVYITAEQWVNEYIRDIRNQQFDQFRIRYRNHVDILLVDDLQFFAGKDASQEEFLHTIQSLEQRGKQIVLSANQYPYEINGLKQKLQNRLASGLIVDLLAFEESDRRTFLEQKAQQSHINLPDGVSEYLATNLKESVRQLEGALLRLDAYQTMSPEQLNLDAAKTLFKPLIQEGPELSMEHILQVVLGYYDIRKSEVMSKSRQKRIVLARQLSMYFIRENMDHSLPEIGRFFGRKHSTVLASVRKINKLLVADAGTQAVVSRLKKAIL